MIRGTCGKFWMRNETAHIHYCSATTRCRRTNTNTKTIHFDATVKLSPDFNRFLMQILSRKLILTQCNGRLSTPILMILLNHRKNAVYSCAMIPAMVSFRYPSVNRQQFVVRSGLQLLFLLLLKWKVDLFESVLLWSLGKLNPLGKKSICTHLSKSKPQSYMKK